MIILRNSADHAATRPARCAATRPAYLLCALGAATTAAASGPQDADWEARSGAPGVFFAENFAGVSDDEALRGRSFVKHRLNSTRMFLEKDNVLSGGSAVRIEVHPGDGEATATFSHSFDGPGASSKSTLKKELYYQFSVYLPHYILDHRFKTINDAANVGHKWAILQEPDQSFGKGEIVVTSLGFTRAVSAYTVGPKGSHGLERRWPANSGNPCSRTSPDYQYQSAVDAGPQTEGPRNDSNSCDLFRRRYGLFYSHVRQNPVAYGRGTVSQQGYPDPESSKNGSVWAPDAWNVIEIYVNEPAQTVKVWHAVRGQPPKLIIDQAGTADMGYRERNYTGVQLLPRLEERAPDPTRESTYAIYDELIASSRPIPFPGGHDLVQGNPAVGTTR